MCHAAAGIPFYWRVETPMTSDGLRIVTHRLVRETYMRTGDFTHVLKVDEPFPIRVDVAVLME